MNLRSLIFIDFDGVLHPLNEGFPYDWSMVRRRRDFFHPDPVNRLLRLCEDCAAGLIASSAWRLDFTVDQLNDVFQGRMIGATPDLQKEEGFANADQRRYREVQAFLSSHPELAHLPWVVFDDQSKHYPPQDNILIVDAKFLLDERLIERARTLLQKH